MGFRAGLRPDPLLSGVAGQGEGRERAAAGTSAIGGRAPLPTPATPHRQAGTFLDPTQPIRIAPTEATEASRKKQGALGSGLPVGRGGAGCRPDPIGARQSILSHKTKTGSRAPRWRRGLAPPPTRPARASTTHRGLGGRRSIKERPGQECLGKGLKHPAPDRGRSFPLLVTGVDGWGPWSPRTTPQERPSPPGPPRHRAVAEGNQELFLVPGQGLTTSSKFQ